MLNPSPQERTDLLKIIDFLHVYEKEQQLKRLQHYKKLANSSLAYYGVFGAVIHPFFSLGNANSQDNSPRNLDLRMCHKLL